jgi:hypothetical protein
MHRVMCPSLALLTEVPKIRLENFPSLSNIISSFLASRSVPLSIITLAPGVSVALARDSAWWKEFGIAIGIYRDRKWTHNSLSASIKVQNITYSTRVSIYITADCASGTTPFTCTTSSYPWHTSLPRVRRVSRSAKLRIQFKLYFPQIALTFRILHHDLVEVLIYENLNWITAAGQFGFL